MMLFQCVNLPNLKENTLEMDKPIYVRQQINTINLNTGDEYLCLVPTTNCSISLIVNAADAHISGYIGYIKRSSL